MSPYVRLVQAIGNFIGKVDAMLNCGGTLCCLRVQVLKEEGDPDVVHVSVNHAGTTMSILQWWCVCRECSYVSIAKSSSQLMIQ